MDRRAGGLLLFALKLAAIVVAGPLAVLGLMALAGPFIASGWARLGLALVVVLLVPALVADRLLPATEGDAPRGGVVTDTASVLWLGFAFAFFGVGIGSTQFMVHAEADRRAAADQPRLAHALHWIAGGGPMLEALDARPVVAAAETDAPPPEAETPEPGPPATTDEPPGVADGPLDPEEIFTRWAPSVVTISVGSGGRMAGSGTGFIISDDGTLVTNQHVIGESTSVSVKLKDGTWADKVELLVADEKKDIAILRISASDVAPATALGDSDKVKVGERVISIGNPLGLEHTLTDGLVSQRRKLRGRKMIQMSAPVSPGNSGGPLFNLRGEVIGVTTAIYASGLAQNLNLAIPINEVKAMLADDYPDAKSIGGGGPDMGTW